MTYKENIKAILECYFTGFKEEIIDSACNRILEQEPCEDCISRQAVDTLIDELARAISDERCCISRGRSTATIMRDIRHLPPVIPQLKTGHWIPRNSFLLQYKCSECGWEAEKYNYCPNCGAKMIEPQE